MTKERRILFSEFALSKSQYLYDKLISLRLSTTLFQGRNPVLLHCQFSPFLTIEISQMRFILVSASA